MVESTVISSSSIPEMSETPEQTEEADDKKLDERRGFPLLRDFRRPMPNEKPDMPLTLEIPLKMELLEAADPMEMPDMLELTEASSSLFMPDMTDPVSGFDRGLRRPGRRIPAPILLAAKREEALDLRPLLELRLELPVSPSMRLAWGKV